MTRTTDIIGQAAMAVGAIFAVAMAVALWPHAGGFGAVVLGLICGAVLAMVLLRGVCREKGIYSGPVTAGAEQAAEAVYTPRAEVQPQAHDASAALVAEVEETSAADEQTTAVRVSEGPGPQEPELEKPEHKEPQPEKPEAEKALPGTTLSRKPVLLVSPRKGGADDLRQIRGLGPKLEEALNAVGIWHYDQLASFGDAQIDWLDETVKGARGRARREAWVEQARALAEEKTTKASPEPGAKEVPA